jgi:DNA-binding NtrC family response regulator
MAKIPQLSSTEQLLPSGEGKPRLTRVARGLVGYTVEEVERELILLSLRHSSGNRTWAATILGISVRTLRNKINEYAAQGIAVARPLGGVHRTSPGPTSTE